MLTYNRRDWSRIFSQLRSKRYWRQEAQAEADAVTIRAAAKEEGLLAEAAGRQAIVEAENAIAAEIVGMKVDLARLEAMPKIVAEMVKTAKKIETIKIHQVTGMGSG